LSIEKLAQILDTADPRLVKQHLNSLIDVFGEEGGEENPHYLNAVAVIRDDILPKLKKNPMYSTEADQLEALISTY